MLAFTSRAAAREIEKVLRSAVANAEANHGLVGDDLLVAAAYVDEGPTIKRWRARARGRVARIRKRTCHITIRLAPAERSGLAERRGEGPIATEAPKRPRRAASVKKEPVAAPEAAAVEIEPVAEPPKAETSPKAEKPKAAPKPRARKTEAAAEEKPKTKKRASGSKTTEEADT